MPPAVRILGHGLAGALLAWELERRRVPFEVLELPVATPSASRVGGGIINPVTGQRLVKSWRVDEYLPRALAVYREIEQAFAVPLVTPFRVRRLFTDGDEQAVAERKVGQGELRPYINDIDAEGCWIDGAVRVDTGRLVDVLKTCWRQRGVFRKISAEHVASSDCPTIRAIGVGELTFPEFQRARFQPVKGEVITVRAPRLDPGVILNRGHWILPLPPTPAGPDRWESLYARVGATVQRGSADPTPTQAAREELLAFACDLLGTTVELCAHDAGIRMTTPDRRPVIGWSDPARRLGLINGLGSKGALLAPETARQWAEHLTCGKPFESPMDLNRFP